MSKGGTVRRLESLRKKFRNIDAFIVSNDSSVRYFTGFTGGGALLLVTKAKARLFTTPLYGEQSEEETEGIEIEIAKDSILGKLARSKAIRPLKHIGFELGHMLHQEYEKLKSLLKDKELVGFKNLPEKIRMTKDEGEIDYIAKAAEIGDRVFKEITRIIRPGITEKDLAIEIDYLLRKNGGEKPAFDTIIASGPRSSLPHATPTDRKIAEGDFLTFDFGTKFRGYASDMTRTVIVGKFTKEMRKIYDVVLKAQTEAVLKARPGVKFKELDGIARDIIKKEGYGDKFIHSLGHGVGLDVHESPRISKKGKGEVTKGMVFTIEPGIYIKGVGGVRIEDTVVVRDGVTEILTKSPKEFMVL
jgi:Xaa-Pro aminopeptidase